MDRLHMLGVRMTMLMERSPVWMFLVPVAGMTAGFTVIEAAMPFESASVSKGVIGGVAAGAFLGIVAVVARRSWPSALAGLDARTRFTVGKIVAAGGPVPAEYAPHVVRQAEALLRLPYHPVASSIIFGAAAIAKVWSLASAIGSEDGARITGTALVLVALSGLLAMTYRMKGRRQRAESARAQALTFLG